MTCGNPANILQALLQNQRCGSNATSFRDDLKTLIDAIYPVNYLGLGLPVQPVFSGLRRALDDYYFWNRSLDKAEREQFVRQGQIAWSGTAIAQCQRRYLGVWLNASPRRIRDSLSSIRDVTDLGAGDGRMTSALLDKLLSMGLHLSRVTAIDQSLRALELAENRLQSRFGDRLTVHTECGQFQQMKFPDADAEFSLMLASSALHELPNAQKRELLSIIATRSCFLILVELTSDHEVPPSQSADLAWRAAEFYDALMSDAFESLPAELHRATIGAFLLDELLDLWFNDYDNRHNYHLSASGWSRLLEDAGFETPLVDHCVCGSLTTLYILAEVSRSNSHGEVAEDG
jgi:hypothetical protein